MKTCSTLREGGSIQAGRATSPLARCTDPTSGPISSRRHGRSLGFRGRICWMRGMSSSPSLFLVAAPLYLVSSVSALKIRGGGPACWNLISQKLVITLPDMSQQIELARRGCPAAKEMEARSPLSFLFPFAEQPSLSPVSMLQDCQTRKAFQLNISPQNQTSACPVHTILG
jgi:hypothetical protein